ncbi:MAG: HTTM domain-containing protein [Flammeovirgaceae bacterium]|nr:HTTM domain-containing protein [Flammeovirgaceae bacterium]
MLTLRENYYQITKLIKYLSDYCQESTPIAPLVVIRILYGLLMLGSTLRFMLLGWVEDHYIKPVFHFKYYGFEWVEPLNAFGMYAIHILMLVFALMVTLGAWYRWAAFGLFLTFTYCELIDLTYYLNHYYFVSIFGAMMTLLPAHRHFSIDVWRKPHLAVTHVPNWCILVIKGQLGIVYFYAGIAKINEDWLLNALPLKIWLPAHDDMPLLGWTFKYTVTAYVFSWAGMLYDTLIPFFLSWRKTRLAAYLAVIFFHAVTGYLFQIGVFPVVMICLTLVFFSPDFHQKILNYLQKTLFQKNVTSSLSSTCYTLPKFYQKMFFYLFLLHFTFQLLFPFRYLLYDGNLFWNEEGYRFSWRVMLVEKAGTATFYVKDTCTGREGVVDNREFLNAHQEKQMAFQPDMILQFAHFLAAHYRQKGVCSPEVRAEVYVTLNGRPSQLFIDPHVNLAAIKDGWQQKSWILEPKD